MMMTITPEVLLLVSGILVGGYFLRFIGIHTISSFVISGLIGIFLSHFVFSYTPVIHEVFQMISSLLFLILGAGISFGLMNKGTIKTIIISLIILCINFLVIFSSLLVLDVPVHEAIVYALLFSPTSLIIPLMNIERLGKLHEFPASHVVVISTVQSLLILAFMMFLPQLHFDGTSFLSGFYGAIVVALQGIGITVGLLLFERLVLQSLFVKIQRVPMREVSIFTVIVMIGFSVILYTTIGMSLVFAFFAAGVVMPKFGKNTLKGNGVIRDCLVIIFVICVTLMVDPQFMLSNFWFIFVVSLLLWLLKIAGAYFVLRNSGYHTEPSVFITSHIIHSSELTPLVAAAAVSNGVMHMQQFQLILSVIVILLTITPITLVKYPTLIRLVMRFASKRSIHSFTYNNGRVIMKNHVIVCEYGQIQHDVCTILDYAKIPYLVIVNDRNRAESLTSQSKGAFYADPSDKNALELASVKDAEAIIIVSDSDVEQKRIAKGALTSNNRIKVISVTDNESMKYDLANMGVNSIILPSFETGLRISRDLLNIFNVNDDTIEILLKRLKREQFLR